MNYIADIHSHMLYGIDDGAKDCQESLKLIELSYNQGVRKIFFTNHSYGMIDKYMDYHKHFEEITNLAAVHFPDLELYKGCEILSTKKEMPEIISNIKEGIYPTMNGTDYVLMEFYPSTTAGMDEMEYCLKYALIKGYIPIVAHVERYEKIYDNPLKNMKRIKEMGCKVQINLFSVEQDKGLVGGGTRKELANLFLKNGLVDFVGTDTHNLHYKSPEAEIGAKALRAKYGDEYADAVLYKNVERYLG